MTLEDITAEMRRRAGDNAGLGTTVKFDFGDEGTVYLDDSTKSPVIDNRNADAQCTMTMAKDVFEDIAAGRVDAMSAYMSGKLRVDDIGTAMKVAMLLR